MNVDLAKRLITAAESQPYGFLKVRGHDLAGQVREMAAAGLVKASEFHPIDPSRATINEVTDKGHSFVLLSHPKMSSLVPANEAAMVQ